VVTVTTLTLIRCIYTGWVRYCLGTMCSDESESNKTDRSESTSVESESSWREGITDVDSSPWGTEGGATRVALALPP
jgi:hypothetical protein